MQVPANKYNEVRSTIATYAITCKMVEDIITQIGVVNSMRDKAKLSTIVYNTVSDYHRNLNSRTYQGV